MRVLALASVLLIAAAFGTANAQTLSGSWQKVRQGCEPGQETCGIKAKFTIQNSVGGSSSATTLQIYLSDNMTFGGGDILVHSTPVGSLASGASTSVKMDFELEVGTSASGSFLIARLQGTSVAVFANPGPIGIVLFDKLFGPGSVTINAGTRVRWMQRDDGVDHTVTSGSCAGGCESDGKFTSGHEPDFLLFLEDFLHVFTTTGTFPYFCEKHEEDMTGTIVVIP
jgi:plastocyanin